MTAPEPQLLVESSDGVPPLADSGHSVARLTSSAGPVITLVATMFLIWGCHRLTDHQFTIWVGIALAVGVATWLGKNCVPSLLERAIEPTLTVEQATAARVPFIVLACLLTPIAFVQAGGNDFRFWGVGAWLGASVSWIVAWWPSPISPRTRRLQFSTPAVLVGVALFAIVAIGTVERFGQLADIPAEPTSDHAEKLLDITDILDGRHPIFFERNTGREPIQFYFTAYVLVRGFDLPVKFETLKTGTAIADILAIVAVFLLAAELAGFEVGLVAALLHATAAWSTINGSFGLRPSLGPLTAGLALWALLRFLRTGERRDALMTGLLLGIGMYGYSAFRTVPIVVGMALLATVLIDPRRKQLRQRTVTDAFLICSTAGIVFIPLFRYITQYWDRFWYRTATRAGSAELELPGSGIDAVTERLRLLLENNWRAIQMFHWRGDSAWVSFAPGQPALDFITGAGLLVGGTLVLRQLLLTRDIRLATVVVAIPVLLLSSTLALAFPDEVPSFSRSFLVAPIIFTIAALGLVSLRRVLTNVIGPTLSGIMLAILLFLIVEENNDLVEAYDTNYRASVVNSVEIARTITAAESEFGIAQEDIYLISKAHWLDDRNVAFEMGDVGWATTNHIPIGEPIQIDAGSAPMLFVFNTSDEVRIQELWSLWPDGKAYVAMSLRPNMEFGLFFVNIDPADRSELNGIALVPMPNVLAITIRLSTAPLNTCQSNCRIFGAQSEYN